MPDQDNSNKITKGANGPKIPILVKIALKNSLITKDQLKEVLVLQKKLKETGKRVILADILSAKKMIAKDMLNRLVIAATREQDKEFAILAAEKNYVSTDEAQKALDKQAQCFKDGGKCLLVGDILVDAGKISPENRDEIFSIQERLEQANYHRKACENKLIKREKPINPPAENKEKLVERNPEEIFDAIKDKKFFQIRKQDKEFGNIAISKNYLTSNELMAALNQQIELYEKKSLRKTIGDILVEAGLLSNTQRDIILLKQDRFGKVDKRFGEIAVEKGYINKNTLEQTITGRTEEEKTKRIGEVLTARGLLTAEQCREIIKEQTGEDDDEEIDYDISTVVLNGYEFELAVSKDRMQAFLSRSIDITEELSPSEIRAMLLEEKIGFGIVDETMINGFLKHDTHKNKKFLIAQGKHPAPGRDGHIKYHFDIDHLKVGALNDEGYIDFKDRGEIPHVGKDDLLAEKVPMVPSEQGIDIYGIPVAVPTRKDKKLRAGSGVAISEDGTKAYAKLDGRPMLALGGRISVVSQIKIKGDVGLETGHVEFDGSVDITGAVNNGFRVKAGSLKAREIMAAEIIAQGDVIVSGGICGATINAKGKVSAKYIEKADISCYGDVETQKEVIDSKIITSGSCKVKRGKVVSSEIAAKKGIEAIEIGTQLSRPCKLHVGVDMHSQNEIMAIDKKISGLEDRLQEFKNKAGEIKIEEDKTHEKIAELAQVQDRSTIEQRALLKKIEEMKEQGDEQGITASENEIKELKKKAEEADREIGGLFDKQDELAEKSKEISTEIQEKKDAVQELMDIKSAIVKLAEEDQGLPLVNVSGTIYEGTAVYGPNSSIMLKKNMSRSKIREVRSQDKEPDSDWVMKFFS